MLNANFDESSDADATLKYGDLLAFAPLASHSIITAGGFVDDGIYAEALVPDADLINDCGACCTEDVSASATYASAILEVCE